MEDDATIRTLFNKYDIKKSESLDITDLESLFFDVLINLGEKNPEKRKYELARQSLDIFDKNKNGTIEFNEFLDIIDFLIDEKGYEIE